jgi:hypothetical protein
MTDRAQFEAMLEALINDDQQAAKEIFHNIVVGKSREIYESLLEDDFGGEEPAMEEEADDEDESAAPKAKDQGNPYGSDDEESDDEEDTDSEEDDAEGEDDMDMDMDGEEEGGDIEDRVMDLEDALEDLKAEFEQLMADEENEPEHHDGMSDPSFGGDEMGGDLETELMEYVNKVGTPTPGDNGVNTKSLIDNMKNDMGGTTANIAKNFSTTTGGTEGGLLKPSTAKLDGGNVNVPGNKKAPAYKNDSKGHGAEKKGARPGPSVGAGTGEHEQGGEKNTQATLRPIKK